MANEYEYVAPCPSRGCEPHIFGELCHWCKHKLDPWPRRGTELSKDVVERVMRLRLLAALAPLLTKPIPLRFENPESDLGDLADFAGAHSKIPWATGTSLVEAAELIVKDALDNGNLDEEGGWIRG